MAIPLDTHAQADRALKALEREKKQEGDEKATAWTFVWTLFFFKMATVGAIWYAASGSSEANGLLAATTWYWLIIPIVAVSGLVAFRWRLLKARRRREVLRRAEWLAHDDEAPPRITDADVRLLFHPGGPHEGPGA